MADSARLRVFVEGGVGCGGFSYQFELDEDSLEIAVLDRSRAGRKFKRFETAEIKELLGG